MDFTNTILLFLPGKSFSQPGGVVQVVVEWEGDHQSGGIVVVGFCKARTFL